MTNWILNGQKGDYDWKHNDEYKHCPYCNADNHMGTFKMGNWEKKYSCGSTIKAEWSNDGYTVNYETQCRLEEGLYNGKKVLGRVLAPVKYKVKNK